MTSYAHTAPVDLRDRVRWLPAGTALATAG
jgi:hypothetical protein